MKILISSYLFAPSIGGVETVSRLLAEEFCRLGHQVKVITFTNAGDKTLPGFHMEQLEIIRNPGRTELLQAVGWSDCVFHNNICLKTLWPLLCHRRPCFITHQTWIRRDDGTIGWQDRLKRSALHCAKSVSISSAVAKSLPVASRIIPNPFDDKVFRIMPGIARDKEFIFVGRLVSDKGVDLLLEAMALLLRENIEPRLTIIGSGPDEKGLKAQAEKLGLHKVYFLGARTGVELANLLNQHKVLVVPSRWEEPFGIVALEGIACGCFVIGSAGGGLVDAIGSCGKTFRNGDVKELASLLKAVVCESTCCELPEEAREAHLQRHSRGSIAREYLQLFSEALDRR